MNTRWLLVLLVGLAISIGLDVANWADAPERVPVHFGIDGVADRWSSSDEALLIGILLKLFLAGLFPLLSYCVKIFPASMVNLPNKRAWLEAGLHDQLIGLMFPRMTVFALALLAFFTALGELSHGALERQPAALDMTLFWGVMIAFLLFTTGWIVELVLRMKRGPDAQR